MAGVKISELDEATILGNDDVLPIVQGDTTKKVKKQTLVKLYAALGQNTDGSVTQKAITDAINGVDGSLNNKAEKSDTLAGYGIEDAYTKQEIDGKLAGAFHYKGTVSTVADLPSSGNKTGDTYNVSSTGSNYCWDGSTWDKLSENIDLSGKQDALNTNQLAAVNSGINSTKVAKLDGIESGAQVNVKPDWDASAGEDAEILNKPAIGNGATTFTYDGTSIGSSTANQTANNTIAIPVVLANNAGAHNSLYRGKNLGTSITAAQWVAIKAGTFEDMFIGDYWVIGGVNWRIAEFDCWLNFGSTQTTAHHVVIVPDTSLYNAQMNTSNTTSGGYVGSAMYTANLANAKTAINNAFGSTHILSHKEYLTSGIASDGRPNAGDWYDSTVELMTEAMVYGDSVFRTSAIGTDPWSTNRIYTVDYSQLALFRLDRSKICNRTTWWLRDIVSAAHFAYVNNGGYAGNYGASYSHGVRPAFAIYQA